MSEIAYLGLGSSLGDRERNLREAVERIDAAGSGITVVAISPVYETPHLGLELGDSERFPPHFNLVLKVETLLLPEALLALVQAVEEAGKRKRSERWGPRTIDIDILVYGNIVYHTEQLTLPHPGIANRGFVLRPLADIDNLLTLPDGRKIADLLETEAIRSQPFKSVGWS